jgi:hypothetical protein
MPPFGRIRVSALHACMHACITDFPLKNCAHWTYLYCGVWLASSEDKRPCFVERKKDLSARTQKVRNS